MQQSFACRFILLVVRASAVEPVKGVQFAKPEFAFTTGLSEAVQEFDLPFTNHTDRAIKVLSVETSCSCMKVSALDKQVEAGATSGVRCVVQIPNSIGPIQKLIILNTDAPSGGMHVVRIRVDVPGIFTLTPPRLSWPTGSATTGKAVRIQVADAAAPVNITKVECPGGLFEWSLKTIQAGREYELLIQPKSTSNQTIGFFQIQTDSAIPRHQRLGFQVVIEPALNPAR